VVGGNASEVKTASRTVLAEEETTEAIRALIRERESAENAGVGSRQDRKTGPCELCFRPGKILTFHHLIPRHCLRKKRFRNRFSTAEMGSRGLWLCAACHGGIHDLIPDEKILGWCYNTPELLLAHDGVRKHVAWVKKQK
jgi:hypothetical protein